MESTELVDYYEVLQLSPNADGETIERVYRVLAKRLHPDNSHTGNAELFSQVREAYGILSDPDKRAAYDVQYEELRGRIWQIFDQESASNSFEGDKRVFDGILSLLYVALRRDINHAGMGPVEIEKMLGCPTEHLTFHLWYLKKKGWVEVQDNGQIALTVDGVDEVVSGNLMLKADRLLRGDIERDANGDREEASPPGRIEGGNKLEGEGEAGDGDQEPGTRESGARSQ